MTVKFLGDISENLAPKIYEEIRELNQKFFEERKLQYTMKGVGQFNKFSVIWIKLNGNIALLQEIKDILEENLFKKYHIERDKRAQFKPHLTIGRLNKKRIDFKSFESFKNIINQNKDTKYGIFTIEQIKLKKSVLTPNGPIYSDLVY